jgi:hypothetical protein
MSVLLLDGFCVLANGSAMRSCAREKQIQVVAVFGIPMDFILGPRMDSTDKNFDKKLLRLRLIVSMDRTSVRGSHLGRQI